MATYSPMASGVLTLLADRPVAYHPKLATALGGVKEAILVSQLLYWDGKGKSPDGWIWKTVEEFTEETGLSYEEQRGARRRLKKLGVLAEERRGTPARLWFKLRFTELNKLIDQAFFQDKSRENPNSRSGKSPDQDLGKAQIKSEEDPRSITESTPESTTENTSEIPLSSNEDKGQEEQAEFQTPVNWPGWREEIRSGNSPAAIVRMCSVLFPDHDPPAFGHIGTVVRRTCNGDYLRFGAVLWEQSSRPVNGNPISYAEATIKGQKGSLRRSGLGTNPKTKEAEPAGAAGIRAWMDQEGIQEDEVWQGAVL